MADATARIVEKVADRFVRRLVNALEAGLAAGAAEISEVQLAGALERGSRTAAQQLVARAVPGDYLRTLARRQPMSDHLLDVAEASANATRCAVRPLVEPGAREQLRPRGRLSQTMTELAVQQVERQVASPLTRALLPGRTAEGEEMVDTVVRVGTQRHGLNVHVFDDGDSHRISVPSRIRRRLLRWSLQTGVRLHTVALDHRDAARSSGHGYYYAPGIQSMVLGRMTKVRDGQHLRDLLKG